MTERERNALVVLATLWKHICTIKYAQTRAPSIHAQYAVQNTNALITRWTVKRNHIKRTTERQQNERGKKKMKENKPYDTYVLCIYPICHDGILVWKIFPQSPSRYGNFFPPLQIHNGNVKKNNKNTQFESGFFTMSALFHFFRFVSFHFITMIWLCCCY